MAILQLYSPSSTGIIDLPVDDKIKNSRYSSHGNDRQNENVHGPQHVHVHDVHNHVMFDHGYEKKLGQGKGI
nr:hypothetical protein [Sphingobacterium sp. 1.A.4]